MAAEWWEKGSSLPDLSQSFKDSNGDGIGDLNGITEKLDYLKKTGSGCDLDARCIVLHG